MSAFEFGMSEATGKTIEGVLSEISNKLPGLDTQGMIEEAAKNVSSVVSGCEAFFASSNITSTLLSPSTPFLDCEKAFLLGNNAFSRSECWEIQKGPSSSTCGEIFLQQLSDAFTNACKDPTFDWSKFGIILLCVFAGIALFAVGGVYTQSRWCNKPQNNTPSQPKNITSSSHIPAKEEANEYSPLV